MNSKSGIAKRPNVDQIRQTISGFPRDNRFANINVNKQVQWFTQIIQNIIPNYIPHETITCDDRNPSWIDEKIKILVLHKNCACIARSWDRNITDMNFNLFKHI